MANEFIGNYAPDDFTIVISAQGQVHRVTGFADGSFVTFERLVPTSTPYQGIGDNPFMRTKRRVTAMTMTVTLHQGSPSNSALQSLLDADSNTPGGDWIFACTAKDTSGQTVVSSNSAIIAGPPTVGFSSDVETRDWQIYMFGSDLFIGGNMLLDDATVAFMENTGADVDPRWVLGGA